MKELIAAGADINKGDKDGKPLLINVVKSGKFDCVEEILEAGVDVNVTDKYGYTALMAAVEYPNETIVNLFLRKGAEINAKNNGDETALHLAVTHGQAELQGEQFGAPSKYSIFTKIVYRLLQAGAQLDDTYADFIPATAHLKLSTLMTSDTHILKMLMAAGTELKETRLLECDDSLEGLARKSIRKYLKQFQPERNLYTTIPQLGLPQRLQAYLLFWTQQEIETNLKKDEKKLLFCTRDRDTNGVLSLIHKGVDVNVQDEKGMTPLMLASQAGHVDLVAKLIERGASRNVQSNSGDTALIYATKENKINCVQKLIELGANVNIQGGNGQTALMHATRNEDGNCLEALLEGGANTDITDHDGYTTLARAIERDSLVSVDKLIRAGVDVDYAFSVDKLIRAGINVNYTSREHITPLSVAAVIGQVDIVKKLIKAGADLNVGALTPLYLAANEGHIGCVKELIQAGADLNNGIFDGKGDTPLMAAAQNVSSDCFSTLLKAGAECDTTDLALMAASFVRQSQTSEGTVHNITIKM